MTKVKCILGYFDTKLNRHVAVDEELEVAEERAAQLTRAKVAIEISDNAAQPVKAPKRSRAKKEA